MLALMDKHGTDWAKPWASIGAPKNAETGKAYRGSNSFWLALTALNNGYETPIWATFKQWKKLGATIKKGESNTPIFFFSVFEKENKQTGEKETLRFWKHFQVFNAAQVEGYEAPPKPSGADKIAAAELFIANSGADIRHGGQSAFYKPSADYIQMPPIESFIETEGYYSTMLHELTHWTGHKSRCDRDLTGGFDSENYAREELIAECGAALLCMNLGITKAPTPNHAKYLNNWMQAINNDYKAIFAAMSAAQKAIDYLESLQESAAPVLLDSGKFEAIAAE